MTVGKVCNHREVAVTGAGSSLHETAKRMRDYHVGDTICSFLVLSTVTIPVKPL